jgi:hypothetical protein
MSKPNKQQQFRRTVESKIYQTALLNALLKTALTEDSNLIQNGGFEDTNCNNDWCYVADLVIPHWTSSIGEIEVVNSKHYPQHEGSCDHEIEPQDVSAYKSGLALQRDFHLYHQLKEEDPESIYRTDTYPRSFFKNKFSLSLRQSNIDRLNQKWGEECPELNDDEDRDNAARKAAIELDLAPDYDLTTKALNSVLDRTNHLVPSNQQVHSFRLNLINRETLYTLDLLNEQCKFWKRKGETCVNCKEMPETNDHVWECKHIYDQFNEYKKRTLELIREALKKRCSDNKTPFTDTRYDHLVHQPILPSRCRPKR